MVSAPGGGVSRRRRLAMFAALGPNVAFAAAPARGNHRNLMGAAGRLADGKS